MPENRIILGALALSLLLHLLLAVATWHIPLMPKIDLAEAAQREGEIELFLLPDPAAPPETRMPDRYTEIPERLASDVPPEQPDYLALHHALAADNVLGGDGQTPTAQQEWEHEQVRIDREDLTGADGVTLVAPSAPQVSGQEGRRGQDDQADLDSEQARDQGGWALADPRQSAQPEAENKAEESAEGDARTEQWWGDDAPSILKQGNQGQGGDRGFDFNQAARGKVTSGVAFDQDFSLNTYEWDYAPWMHRFINELYRHWVSPYAYRLGIIDGRTVLKLVVAKNGAMVSLEVLETDGHQSLHDASSAALKAFAPYAPLPPHFPEENLVITLGLYYPALRR